MSTAVALPIDLYSDETRADPFPAYAQMRDAGPVVLLERDLVAVPRFADVRAALGDWELFSSAVPGAPKGSFDAATELAPHLPVSVVADLVGLPAEGRENSSSRCSRPTCCRHSTRPSTPPVV